jgi:hypothetical protein
VIVSKNPSYKFGYVEMFAKFPSHKWPLWLGGWLQWSYRDTITPSNSYYNEIDFAENGGEISYNGYRWEIIGGYRILHAYLGMIMGYVVQILLMFYHLQIRYRVVFINLQYNGTHTR